MIGLAAAGLCSAVFADVTSANIVGYAEQSVDGVAGSIMITPNFLNVGDNDYITLNDITVSGYTANQSGAIHVKVLNAGGGTEEDETWGTKDFRWYDNSISGKGDKVGWYNKGGNTKVDAKSIKFYRGDALWVTRKAGFSLQISGQVYTADKMTCSIDGVAGSIGIGNPYHDTIDLYDIVVKGYTSNQSGAIHVKVLNAGGGTEEDETWGTKDFRWYDNSISGKGDKVGWYNKGGNTKIEKGQVTFPAGQGLWVTRKAGFYVEITNPVKF